MGWNLPANRYDEIRSTVADLIEDWGVSVYPFSIWSLLRKMNIKTMPYSALPQAKRQDLLDKYPDAFTVYPPDFNPRKTTIYYNDEDVDRDRIRFTLAHELGHLVLEHPDTDEETYEHEANIFANYFLAPAPLILEYSSIDYAVVSYDFAVSLSCAHTPLAIARLSGDCTVPESPQSTKSAFLTSAALKKEVIYLLASNEK